MSSSVELIRDVTVRRPVEAPDDGARFRERVERAAYELGTPQLAFNPEISDRAVLADETLFFRTEHIVIGGPDGEVFSTLTTSFAHRALQLLAIVLACVLAVAVGLPVLMLLEPFIFPGYGVVVVIGLVVLMPALVQATHRLVLEHWLAAQQRRIAERLVPALQAASPYRSADETK
jgi:hypothetical protein